MTEEKGITLSAETSVLGIAFGRRIARGERSFARIADAFFAVLERNSAA